MSAGSERRLAAIVFPGLQPTFMLARFDAGPDHPRFRAVLRHIGRPEA